MNSLKVLFIAPLFDIVITHNHITNSLPPSYENDITIEFPHADDSELRSAKYNDFLTPDIFFEKIDAEKEWEESIKKAKKFDPLVDESFLQK